MAGEGAACRWANSSRRSWWQGIASCGSISRDTARAGAGQSRFRTSCARYRRWPRRRTARRGGRPLARRGGAWCRDAPRLAARPRGIRQSSGVDRRARAQLRSPAGDSGVDSRGDAPPPRAPLRRSALRKSTVSTSSNNSAFRRCSSTTTMTPKCRSSTRCVCRERSGGAAAQDLRTRAPPAAPEPRRHRGGRRFRQRSG